MYDLREVKAWRHPKKEQIFIFFLNTVRTIELSDLSRFQLTFHCNIPNFVARSSDVPYEAKKFISNSQAGF